MESTILERGPYRYVEEGQGTPLVLLHGLFGALSNFQEVRAHFSKRFRVITPMLPIYMSCSRPMQRIWPSTSQAS